MNRYRKKPVVIEAVQFLGWRNADEIRRWGTDIFYVPPGGEHTLRHEYEKDRSNGHVDDAPAFLVIRTLEGDMRADVSDWIIKGIKGEFYPCKPDIFTATYDNEVARPE